MNLAQAARLEEVVRSAGRDEQAPSFEDYRDRLSRLSQADLQDWLRGRLRGTEDLTSFEGSAGERLYEVIARIYPLFEETSRRRVTQSLRVFFEEWRDDPEGPWSGEPADELLMLLHTVILKSSSRDEFGPILMDLARRLPAPGEWTDDEPSVHFKVLQGLNALGYRAPSLFWDEQRLRGDDRYDRVIHEGLELSDERD